MKTATKQKIPFIVVLIWNGKRHEFDMNEGHDAELFVEVVETIKKIK